MKNSVRWSANLLIILGACFGTVSCVESPPVQEPPFPKAQAQAYPAHAKVRTTVFYVGEPSDSDNGYIHNLTSAWDDKWSVHFGGVDDPNPAKRKNFRPSRFKPKENPFYIALPYNDFTEHGRRRPDVSRIYWSQTKKWAAGESMCKNRWVRVTKGGRVAYAQWEDVGPFLENDVNYVFGDAQPSNRRLEKAGLDVSPAVRDFLKLEDVDVTNWQFVDVSEVPDGPWKEIITTNSASW